MAELIYQTDCYIKDFEAKVTRVEGNKVFLDRTAFHPISGGVANDTGVHRVQLRQMECN
jgi:Ala-tRNA(Pro) hydrolase (EC 3.1.1.-)